jgi:hypothetical protein
VAGTTRRSGRRIAARREERVATFGLPFWLLQKKGGNVSDFHGCDRKQEGDEGLWR